MREYQSHIMEHILKFLHWLEEEGVALDQVYAEGSLASPFPPEDEKDFQKARDIVKFIDEIPGGFFIYRAGGDEQILYANRGLLRMLQCDTMEEFREFTGNSFRGIVHPDELDDVERSIERQIFENRQELDYVEYRIRCKDGSERWVEDYGHFVREKTVGDVFYVFLGDSSEERTRQQTEQRRVLAEALEKANMAVKAKNTFLSNISHDMRTPLNAIFGFTSLARSNIRETETALDNLQQIEKASRQLLDMITKVLDVSALGSAGGPTEVECDLCHVVREAYDFLRPQAREKSISFTLDCSGVVHSGIYADQEKLKQLVLSLANNAVTYTKPGGRVSITLTEEEALPDNYMVYHLKVSDNGIGIGKEYLESVFEPFGREKNSTLSGVHGIGLGLTIAKSIVDMMHGKIDVKSKVNEGSIFTVSLAFHVQPMADASAGEEAGALQAGLRILLVEDNDINREIETELLERIGFIIDPVENGRVALERMEQAAPGDYDLIIMDLQMPVMDGWEASAAIRKLPDPTLAHIPIISLSANILISDQRKAVESGINLCLTKPMEYDALLEGIEKLMGRRNI
ncbi:MAG: response regulator [Lachnospiraceae bacterium]|nr:response regulator [Lachnospiraceae bacterium]